jgi:hypothetical protein
MLYDWNGLPALMMPTLAYAMRQPGGSWQRASADRIAQEAQPLAEQEFWRRFRDWEMPDFPVAFAALDRRAGAPAGDRMLTGPGIADRH